MYKRDITEVKEIVVRPVRQGHANAAVIDPGKWEKNDPFLVMMENKFQKGAFEVHPHRGMETVTFVIDGALEHYDSHTGERGVLGPGDVQWMTAGSGVVHNEVPPDGVTAHTLQLWINLPRDKKMIAPRYQNLKSTEMPVRKENGTEIRVFSGSSMDVVAPTKNYVPVTMVEINMEPGASISHDLPGRYNGFIYILEGSGVFGRNGVKASKNQVLWLGEGHETKSEVEITSTTSLRLILYAGEPLREPVVARGPFVMNTEEEILQAYNDYRQGTFLKD